MHRNEDKESGNEVTLGDYFLLAVGVFAVSIMGFLILSLLIGQVTHDWFQKITQQVVVSTSTVSISSENVQCTKDGGVFSVEGKKVHFEYDGYYSVTDDPNYTLQCTRPEKNLWSQTLTITN